MSAAPITVIGPGYIGHVDDSTPPSPRSRSITTQVKSPRVLTAIEADQLSDRIEQLQARLAASRGNESDDDSKNDGTTTREVSLVRTNSTSKTSLTDSMGSLDKLDAEILRKMAKISLLEKQIENFRTHIATQDSSIASLESEKKALGELLAIQNKAAGELQEEKARLIKLIEAKDEAQTSPNALHQAETNRLQTQLKKVRLLAASLFAVVVAGVAYIVGDCSRRNRTPE